MPLGYDAVDKKLVVNEAEAETVRAIFAAFVELKSVLATLRCAQQQDLRTKLRQRLGKPVGGTHFHYGALRCLLSNRTYVGAVEHKGKIHAGQHQAIIERSLYDEAQAILASRSTTAMRQPARLTNRFLQNLDGLPHSWGEQEQLLLG